MTNMKYFIRAAIIDLDGVIVKTADQHAKTWKAAFDQYNERRRNSGKKTYKEFSLEDDYPRHLAGLPRYDGVSQFLKSRNIELSYGSPEDAGTEESVCGIGNLKNELFQELIEKEGVEVFEENVEMVRSWKKEGLKTAIVSSSKNCKQMLDAAQLNDLFDVRIDGIIAAERNIPGKPAPDTFLKAVDKLEVPAGEALVVEDSAAGVEAAKNGNFKLIIGIRNSSSGEDKLLEQGADFVVDDLGELEIELRQERSPVELPLVLKHLPQLKEILMEKKPLFFLDFDGTLSPIVEDHQNAAISEEMRRLVRELSKKYPVAVVSGRGLADVRKRVDLPDLFYAGSHGFEIAGPNNYSKDHEEAVKVIPVFDEIEPILKKKLETISGVDFERKKFTLAIHYRQVPEEQQENVHENVVAVLKDYPEVLKSDGKKVIEIRPAIDWHKGKAVEFLKNELKQNQDPLSIYVGDDVTDEDAFRTVYNGIGILVGEHSRNTYADYRLERQEEVKEFFEALLED